MPRRFCSVCRRFRDGLEEWWGIDDSGAWVCEACDNADTAKLLVPRVRCPQCNVSAPHEPGLPGGPALCEHAASQYEYPPASREEDGMRTSGKSGGWPNA